MSKHILLVSLALFLFFGCLNEIPMESATIKIINTGNYNIDSVRIFESMDYDRSKDNLLKIGEYIASPSLPLIYDKSFTVMAGVAYYVEVHYSYMTDSYRMMKTDILTKDQVLDISFYYSY